MIGATATRSAGVVKLHEAPQALATPAGRYTTSPGKEIVMPYKRTVPRVCQQCDAPFLADQHEVNRGRALFCSPDCYRESSNFAARRPEAERFWGKVDKNGPVPAHRPELGPCWVWTAHLNEHGYGRFATGSKRDGTWRLRLAHDWAYEAEVGPIPEGLVPDHLCRTRACVRPAHLEPVTGQVNILRGESPAAHHARRTHCGEGHELTPANVLVRSDGGRRCRTCKTIRDRAFKARAS